MRKVVLVGILFVLLFSGCTDKSGATKALFQNGYSSIKLNGYDFWGCASGDTFATKFSAINSAGFKVDGVVCSGWFKGATIRTY